MSKALEAISRVLYGKKPSALSHVKKRALKDAMYGATFGGSESIKNVPLGLGLALGAGHIRRGFQAMNPLSKVDSYGKILADAVVDGGSAGLSEGAIRGYLDFRKAKKAYDRRKNITNAAILSTPILYLGNEERKNMKDLRKVAMATMGYGKGAVSTPQMPGMMANVNPMRPPMQTPIPAMARGGVVKKPTVALIGEEGPEAVIPLGKRKKDKRNAKRVAKKILEKRAASKNQLRKSLLYLGGRNMSSVLGGSSLSSSQAATLRKGRIPVRKPQSQTGISLPSQKTHLFTRIFRPNRAKADDFARDVIDNQTAGRLAAFQIAKAKKEGKGIPYQVRKMISQAKERRKMMGNKSKQTQNLTNQMKNL